MLPAAFQLLHSGVSGAVCSQSNGSPALDCASSSVPTANSHSTAVSPDPACSATTLLVPACSPGGTAAVAIAAAEAAAGGDGDGLQPQQLILKLFAADAERSLAAGVASAALARASVELPPRAWEGLQEGSQVLAAEEELRPASDEGEVLILKLAAHSGGNAVLAGLHALHIDAVLSVEASQYVCSDSASAAGELLCAAAPGSARRAALQQLPVSGCWVPAASDSPDLATFHRRLSRGPGLAAMETRVPVFRSQDELQGASVLLGPDQPGASFLAGSATVASSPAGSSAEGDHLPDATTGTACSAGVPQLPCAVQMLAGSPDPAATTCGADEEAKPALVCESVEQGDAATLLVACRATLQEEEALGAAPGSGDLGGTSILLPPTPVMVSGAWQAHLTLYLILALRAAGNKKFLSYGMGMVGSVA